MRPHDCPCCECPPVRLVVDTSAEFWPLVAASDAPTYPYQRRTPAMVTGEQEVA